MPGATVPLGFPYPLAGDPLDGPGDIKALADAVDASVTATLVAAASAAAPPAFKITGGLQPIPNSMLTFLRYDTVVYDNTGGVDLSTNASSVFLDTATYVVAMNVVFAPSLFGERFVAIEESFFMFAIERQTPSQEATFPTALSLVGQKLISSPNALHVEVFQNSGATLNVTSCSLAAWRVGP
jgi:hypothetical protein